MVNEVKNVLNKIKILHVLHTIYRNRSFKWVLLLFLFIVILMFIISNIEKTSNEPFGSVINVFYWAVVTICTVGYGDIAPQNVISRILTIFLIITGVLLMSFMTATFASIFTATRIREGMGLKKIDLEKHIAICGINNNIESVIQSIISAAGTSVPDIVLINASPESEITSLIERFPETSIHFVSGDYTSESILLRASISKVSSVIILADTGPEGTDKPDDRTLIATLAIKSMSKDVGVCAEVIDAKSVSHLKRAGVDQLVISGEFSGFLLANAVMSPGIPLALKKIISIKDGSDMRRDIIPREFVGRTFGELMMDYIERCGYVLIGIITEKKSFDMENILTGETSAIDDFIRRKFDEAGRSLEIESKGRFNVSINPGKNYIITEDDYAIVITPAKEEA